MGLLDKFLGKKSDINVSGMELGKIDDLIKMLGDNTSNVDLSADKLTGFQDILGKYLKSGNANTAVVTQLKDGLLNRFKGSKNPLVDTILNELNTWLSKNK